MLQLRIKDTTARVVFEGRWSDGWQSAAPCLDAASYLMCVQGGPSNLPMQLPFEVREGIATNLDVDLAACATVRFRVRSELELPVTLVGQLERRRGESPRTDVVFHRGESVRAGLEPGAYSLNIDHLGLEGSLDFVVPRPGGVDTEVEVLVRNAGPH